MKGVWNTPVEKGIWGGEEVSRVWPGQDQTSNYLLSVCQQWYHNVLHLMAWNSRHRLTCNTDHIGMECCMNFLTFRDTALTVRLMKKQVSYCGYSWTWHLDIRNIISQPTSEQSTGLYWTIYHRFDLNVRAYGTEHNNS